MAAPSGHCMPSIGASIATERAARPVVGQSRNAAVLVIGPVRNARPDDDQPPTGSTCGTVVGKECAHGSEVLGLVQALNTGHDGSWSTCHANSALDALHRLETLIIQAAPAWPLRAVRQQLTRSVDAVVHVARTGSAARRVVEVAEVVADPDRLQLQPLVEATAVVGPITRSRASA